MTQEVFVIGERKIQNVNGSYLVSIPKEWVLNNNLDKGDSVIWILEENNHKQLKMKLKYDEGD